MPFIFGHNIASTINKTTCKCSDPVFTNYIEVPQELKDLHKDMVLSTAVTFVGRLGIFISGSRGICFSMQEHILVQTMETLANATNNVIILQFTQFPC